MINTGTDSTIIKVSRTVLVNSKVTANPEGGDVVTVENAQGTVLTLKEIVKGTYVSPPVSLDNTKQYRLRIKTTGGKVYLSDLVDAKISPPIDSIGYNVQGAGIQIYANTHDPNNNSHYYKYTFRETWQYNAMYKSNYIFSYKDTSMHLRTPAQQVYSCFGSDTSAHTVLSSTAALGQDVAYQVPVTTIDGTSEKIETKYSILLRQQVITRQAYDFYQNLKKNTEDLGNIFDAQPSLLVGNMHNLADAAEPVIGYISAGTTQQKRIYIVKSSLPQSFKTLYPVPGCIIQGAIHYPSHDFRYPPGKPIGVANIFYIEEVLYPVLGYKLYPGTPQFFALDGDPMGGGFSISTIPCSDCTLRGHIAQPAFWK
jgi:hypothetical protein